VHTKFVQKLFKLFLKIETNLDSQSIYLTQNVFQSFQSSDDWNSSRRRTGIVGGLEKRQQNNIRTFVRMYEYYTNNCLNKKREGP